MGKGDLYLNIRYELAFEKSMVFVDGPRQCARDVMFQL
jgi:hypothetical protein